MHLIWAKGQETDMYVHIPKSGLEVGEPSQPNFYRPDELKYHGRRNQRGVTSINFFGMYLFWNARLKVFNLTFFFCWRIVNLLNFSWL